MVKDAPRVITATEQLFEAASVRFAKETGHRPEKAVIYTDTATHFRNGAFVNYWVTHSVDVTVRFFCEMHGKSCLDAAFAKAKKWMSDNLDLAPVGEDRARLCMTTGLLRGATGSPMAHAMRCPCFCWAIVGVLMQGAHFCLLRKVFLAHGSIGRRTVSPLR